MRTSSMVTEAQIGHLRKLIDRLRSDVNGLRADMADAAKERRLKGWRVRWGDYSSTLLSSLTHAEAFVAQNFGSLGDECPSPTVRDLREKTGMIIKIMRVYRKVKS